MRISAVESASAKLCCCPVSSPSDFLSCVFHYDIWLALFFCSDTRLGNWCHLQYCSSWRTDSSCRIKAVGSNENYFAFCFDKFLKVLFQFAMRLDGNQIIDSLPACLEEKLTLQRHCNIDLSCRDFPCFEVLGEVCAVISVWLPHTEQPY